MCCGFLATRVRDVLGDGSALRRPAALRRGARAARHGRRAEVRRGPARGPLPDAQRRRADRRRPRRPARASTRRPAPSATLGLVPVEDPSAYGLVLLDDDAAVTGFLEKPAPDQLRDRPLPDLGRHLRARARGARPDPARPRRLDRARGLAAPGRRGPLRLRRRGAYWLDIGTPERYLQGTRDILAGHVRDRRLRAPRRRAPGRRRRRRGGGRVVPPGVVEAGARVAAGAHVGARGRARRRAPRSASTRSSSAPWCCDGCRDRRRRARPACHPGRRRAHRRAARSSRTAWCSARASTSARTASSPTA